MSWVFAIGLALAAFVAMVLLFRLPRIVWSAVLAALTLGLAGYAFQGHPDEVGAPSAYHPVAPGDGWALVQARKEVLGEDRLSQNSLMLVSDAFMRKGQFANAAAVLGRLVQQDPKNVEGWVGLGNALVEQADGTMTPAALFSFNRATQADPASLAPAFFVGATYLRQGKLIEGRKIWAQAVENSPKNTWWRNELQQRLDRLDELLNRLAAMPEGNTE
ncbi:cytochrome C biosynthesis protein [Altererythrobacter indicus]|uniref:Cytochrome C biosynthesis protein n=1 Tax=Altericroceibacterium indicum TaxID=374177 RepID=A0A845A5V0_9SPHN|nr:cytochrome C biosynthesis protein [Altericroceibacterium indicum]MXP24643.1 cytochrome C biosynthesis protein [Altericroceibacterium indicum]